MNDTMRLVLKLAVVGLVLTAAGALLSRWLDPRRRLLRYLRQALGETPEGVLTDRGGGRALAFNLDAGKIAVLWDGGRKGLVYRLDQLMGAEMTVDNGVVARCFRDRPVMPLDSLPEDVHRALLRLVFDNPRDPDFELELWPALHGRTHEHADPADALKAGRRWLTGAESLMRRAPPRALTKPAPPAPILPDEDEPPPWDEDEAMLGED